MPFYEYQCKHCGHCLEAMQKVNDAPLRKCPHCGKSQLQRLMSAPVFRLKGGGWYETDFKSDQDAKRNLADRPEADSKEVKPAPVPAAAPAADKPAAKEAAKPAAPARQRTARRAVAKKAVKKAVKRPAAGSRARR